MRDVRLRHFRKVVLEQAGNEIEERRNQRAYRFLLVRDIGPHHHTQQIDILVAEFQPLIVEHYAWIGEKREPVVEYLLDVETDAGEVFLGDGHRDEFHPFRVAWLFAHSHYVARGAYEDPVLPHVVRAQVNFHAEFPRLAENCDVSVAPARIFQEMKVVIIPERHDEEIVSYPETVFHGKQFPNLFQTYVLHCLFRWPHKYNEKNDSFQLFAKFDFLTIKWAS